MTKQVKFLLALLLISAGMSVLYSVLEPEKVKNLNTWYHTLRVKRRAYDFDATIKRTKYVYYYFTVISALGIILSFMIQGAGELFVWLSFLSLILSLYYLHPVKKNSDTNEEG